MSSRFRDGRVSRLQLAAAVAVLATLALPG